MTDILEQIMLVLAAAGTACIILAVMISLAIFLLKL